MSYLARARRRAPTHPGEVLREDVLPALKVSVSRAAADLGLSRQALHRILAGKAPITPFTALKLGRFAGNGPELWLAMQSAYDLWHAREQLGDALEQVPVRKVA